MKTLKRVRFTFVLAGMVFGCIFLNSCIAESESKSNDAKAPIKETSIVAEAKCNAKSELRTSMTKLWEDHVAWTRNVILNVFDDLPGTNEAVERLLKNQDDIGDAIRPYYGEEAGNKLTALLHTHILEACELFKATKENNKLKMATIHKAWHLNADSISQFFCNANPNWKISEMKPMMREHLDLTMVEAQARLKRDYDGDIAAYDKVRIEIAKMADMLYMGIAKQFPEKIK